VLAGQEVLERDPQDTTANSLLAVSGLRITAGSLKALRKDAEYPVGSREEALAVTRSLRETLGETALLPIVPPGSEPQAKVVPKRRAVAAPARRPGSPIRPRPPQPAATRSTSSSEPHHPRPAKESPWPRRTVFRSGLRRSAPAGATQL
jgi:hypothetical protein